MSAPCDSRCPECGEDEVDGARCYYCGWHDYNCGLCDACRDSDRSGEAGETQSGSTVGESAGRNGIAQGNAA